MEIITVLDTISNGGKKESKQRKNTPFKMSIPITIFT